MTFMQHLNCMTIFNDIKEILNFYLRMRMMLTWGISKNALIDIDTDIDLDIDDEVLTDWILHLRFASK